MRKLKEYLNRPLSFAVLFAYYNQHGYNCTYSGIYYRIYFYKGCA